MSAERDHREGQIKNCLKQYTDVAHEFEKLNDYETASYFYNKCLEVSVESKYIDGEANAYMGLGICEEKVLNIFQAMGFLETARDKTIEGNISKLEKIVSKELVRVYQIIAIQFQDSNEFDKSLNFFQKCLDASQKAEKKDQEAECYQKIGNIYEKLGDLEKAIEMLNKFLQLCNETESISKSKAGEAHNQLAETHSKNGNVQQAMKHLEERSIIANDEKDKPAQADAFLKLGLLYYQEGMIRKAVDYLQKHFELARADSEVTKS